MQAWYLNENPYPFVPPDVLDPQNFAAFNIRYKIRFNDADAITAGSVLGSGRARPWVLVLNGAKRTLTTTRTTGRPSAATSLLPTRKRAIASSGDKRRMYAVWNCVGIAV